MINVVQDVVRELKCMKEVGIRVPAKALKFANNVDNANSIVEYYDNGMSVSEIADLVIDLA